MEPISHFRDTAHEFLVAVQGLGMFHSNNVGSRGYHLLFDRSRLLKQLTNWIRLGARNLGCPLKADTWRKEAPARREADSGWVWAAGKKDRGAELLIQPCPSRMFHSSFSHSQCALCNG
jgi:hypothetical protein